MTREELSRQQLLERAQALAAYTLPRWSELDTTARLRNSVLEELNTLLAPLFDEAVILTGTMVQNYVKWRLLPRPVGRLYTREHIAYLIVLAIFKEVIPFDHIRKGIRLQTRLMSLQASYDGFCEQLEDSLHRASSFLKNNLLPEQKIALAGLSVYAERLNLAFVCESFAFKQVARILMERDGLMGSYFSVK